MFFSVLVPVYNTSKYLRECVESILLQSFSDFELLLIDDGSNDGSDEICDEYAELYLAVRVIHKQNEGLMMTRRRGFKEAKGEYCVWVDSDDKLYDKCALEKIYNTIIKTGCDLVIYNYVYGEGGGRKERVSHLFDYRTDFVFEGKTKSQLYEKLVTSNSMNNIWIKCPSRNIVDIDTDYSVWKDDICRAEDLFQSFPILSNANKVGYIQEPLYYYRWTLDSISNKPKFKYCDAFKCIFKRENDYLAKWPVPPDIKEKAIRRRLTLYMDVISSCYFSCKKNNDILQWKKFVNKLAGDDFFRNILNGCDKKKVFKYYRLLYFLLCNKQKNAAILVMEVTSKISNFRHREGKKEKHV